MKFLPIYFIVLLLLTSGCAVDYIREDAKAYCVSQTQENQRDAYIECLDNYYQRLKDCADRLICEITGIK